MDFVRDIDAREAMDIGDKDFQYARKIDVEAIRLGLVKSPPEKTGDLFPKDSSFIDIAQWVLPNNEKSGILFCRYNLNSPWEEEKLRDKYHVLFLNHNGKNSEWNEYQLDFNNAIELFNRCLSWKDLVGNIEY